jgi:hypothetical protein
VLAEFSCVALLNCDEVDGFRFTSAAAGRSRPREAEPCATSGEPEGSCRFAADLKRRRAPQRTVEAEVAALRHREASCLLSYNEVLSGIFAVYGPATGGRLVPPETQKILSTAGIQISAALQNL